MKIKYCDTCIFFKRDNEKSNQGMCLSRKDRPIKVYENLTCGNHKEK